MNRNYKVVWNRSLSCFMAVAEYAKAQGKSSSGAVDATSSTSTVISTSTRLFHMSVLCAGLAFAGFSISANATVFNGDTGDNNVNSIRLGFPPTDRMTIQGGEADSGKVATGNNIGVVATNADRSLNVRLAKDLTDLTSADFGGVKISDTGITANDTKITGLQSAGDISLAANAKNAVNADDLNKATARVANGVSSAISSIQSSVVRAKSTVSSGKNIVVSASNNANGSTDYHVTTAADLDVDSITITNGPSMTAQGIDGANKTITGVAAGVKPTDAVNFGQLNSLGYRIGEVEDDANAGISAAMAMASLPQAGVAGRSMIGGGIASYNGESSAAIGLSRVSDNGRWTMNVNGSADTQGNFGGAIGAGLYF